MDSITTPTTRPIAEGLGRSVLPAALAWATARLTRAAAAIREGMSRAAINRRVVRQLSVMSDRELKDIGLVRQDVLDSETLLLEGDASSFLIGRRDERRTARRRIAEGHWPPGGSGHRRS